MNANLVSYIDFSAIHANGYSLIDVICIVLLVLALIIGFITGFPKGTVKSIANYSGLALAYFAGVPVARAIVPTNSISSNFIFDLYYKALPTTDAFTVNIAGMSQIEQVNSMSKALTEMKFPTFFHGFFTSRALVLDGTVSQALASSFTFLTITALCFILLYLVAYILVKAILGKITGLVFGENGKNLLGRLAGMIKCLVSIGFTVLVCMAILITVNQLMINSGNTVLNDWLVEDLRLSDGSTFSIGRLFYNSANSILNWISLR